MNPFDLGVAKYPGSILKDPSGDLISQVKEKPMIIGAHSIIYSKSPEADRAFLRDVFQLSHVDAGDGWLIFGLPPAEVAIHPAEENDVHEFYLQCDDVEALVRRMTELNIVCGEVQSQGWGRLTHVTLPGGGKLGVYQPRHARPGPSAKPNLPKKKAPKPRAKRSVSPRARKKSGRKSGRR